MSTTEMGASSASIPTSTPSTRAAGAEALLDELSIYIRPVLLGDGLRLFEQHGAAPVEMEIAEVSQSVGSAYVRFRTLPKEN